MDGYDIAPDTDLGPELFDEMEGPPDVVERLRRSAFAKVEMELMTTYAGSVAEAVHSRCGLTFSLATGGKDDFFKMADLLDRWYPDARSRTEAWHVAERRARALVRSDAGWRAISAVANALRENTALSGDDVDRLCAAAYGRKRPSPIAVQEHWPPSVKTIRAGWLPDDAWEGRTPPYAVREPSTQADRNHEVSPELAPAISVPD